MSQQIQSSRIWLCTTTLILALVYFELGIAVAGVAGQKPVTASKAVDPGVRPLPSAAGGPLAGLGAYEKAFFEAAKAIFIEIDTVPEGLGPRFNLDSCAGCHAFPDVGGSSPKINPQVAVATKNGAKNDVPSFIGVNGPVREARFVLNPDGKTPDGGVHDLFVITKRSDAPGCNIKQPDFTGELAKKNVVFRIPTPLFGLGLVESIPDDYLEEALAAKNALKQSLGISGEFNRSGNDGTINRFGWKAQNKSLLIFAGEAYNVEQGVTNELFPNKRETDPKCLYTSLPEDVTKMTPEVTSGSPASDYASDVVNFAAFMRFLAPPTPVAETTSTARGGQVFQNIGCHACHTMGQNMGQSGYTGQSEIKFFPFSDFALHDMGKGLADGVSQGNANGREFRTAPLWGLGQRIFFLHDGHTSDLYQAIMDHASDGSEANAVIANFKLLSVSDKQDLLNFLRSL